MTMTNTEVTDVFFDIVVNMISSTPSSYKNCSLDKDNDTIAIIAQPDALKNPAWVFVYVKRKDTWVETFHRKYILDLQLCGDEEYTDFTSNIMFSKTDQSFTITLNKTKPDPSTVVLNYKMIDGVWKYIPYI
jgi:hypothetical protein